MSSKGASRLNLKQCLEIQANQYRNVNNRKDYQPEEIEERIHFLKSRKDEKALKALDRAKKRMPVIKLMESLGMVDEGQIAACDWMEDEEYLVLENGFSKILIPPVICSF